MNERITRSFHRLRNIAGLGNSGGRPRALTANSFTSVSLDPPPVLVCIARRSASYATYQGPGGFAVNMLSDAQRDLSDAGLHRPDLRLPLDSGQK